MSTPTLTTELSHLMSAAPTPVPQARRRLLDLVCSALVESLALQHRYETLRANGHSHEAVVEKLFGVPPPGKH